MKREKIKLIAKVLIFLLNIFLLSSATSYNKDSQIDAKISFLLSQNLNDKFGFFHTEIYDEELGNIESFQNANKFVNDVKSDFGTYSSYMYFKNDIDDNFELSNNNENFSFNSKIMWFTYRLDINRSFMESIRLRQFRTNIESRYIESGFDFSIYLPSTIADEILLLSGGQLNSYDDILNFNNGVGLQYSIDINGDLVLGHIRNIFFIEEENEISMSLHHYLNDFVIVYGSSFRQKLSNNFLTMTCYDFFSSNKSVENNLRFLKEYDEARIYSEDISKDINGDIKEIEKLIKNDYSLPIIGIVNIVLAIVVSATLLVGLGLLMNKNKLLSKTTVLNIALFNLVLLLYHVFLKILSFFRYTKLLHYNLSNIWFGTISLVLFLLIVACTSAYMLKIIKDKDATVIIKNVNC